MMRVEVVMAGLDQAVRKYILDEHASLRHMLRQVTLVLEGGVADVSALRRVGGSLLNAVEEHLKTEDRVLVPALVALGEDGSNKASHVQADHEMQRQQMAL